MREYEDSIRLAEQPEFTAPRPVPPPIRTKSKPKVVPTIEEKNNDTEEYIEPVSNPIGSLEGAEEFRDHIEYLKKEYGEDWIRYYMYGSSDDNTPLSNNEMETEEQSVLVKKVSRRRKDKKHKRRKVRKKKKSVEIVAEVEKSDSVEEEYPIEIEHEKPESERVGLYKLSPVSIDDPDIESPRKIGLPKDLFPKVEYTNPFDEDTLSENETDDSNLPVVEEFNEKPLINASDIPNIDIKLNNRLSIIAGKINKDIEEGKSVEFFLESFSGDEWIARKLIVQPKRISEISLMSGGAIIVINTQDIVAISAEEEDERPIVTISTIISDSQKMKSVEHKYNMIDQNDRNILIEEVEAIIKENKSSRTMKCMSCSHKFPVNLNVENCPKCKSDFILIVDTDTNESSEENENSSVLDLLNPFYSTKELPNPDIDEDTVGLQTYFRIEYLGNHEEIIEIFKAGFLQQNNPLHREMYCTYLISNKFLYILKKNRGNTLSFSLEEKRSISGLNTIIVGLFFQYFRLEFESGSGVVVLTSSHKIAHNIILKIQDACRAVKNPIDIQHKTAETLLNIRKMVNISYKPKIESCIRVFQKDKSSKFNSCYPEMHNVKPRTLLLTETYLILCEEDYGRYPLTSVTSNSEPQFKLISKFTWPDVEGFNFSTSNPDYFEIVCYVEEKDFSEQWKLIIQSQEELVKFFNIFSRIWEMHFCIPLTPQYVA
eukprot:TRINITY_DN7142_c0_g2_i1.p1 TRINITY_DN7142_c0_g2~~TRINITY_DN7142_c0_g2_i1.p1  ORF type:complete len:771 (+),score=179.78 TRINITY_DN7142_c0_g2_i1:176-2314(+)